MGTMFSFHVDPGECPVGEAMQADASACARLHELDDIFSTWKPAQPDEPVENRRAPPWRMLPG